MSGEGEVQESITSELDVLYVVKACYDFEASSDDELSIREGDIISVTKVLDGWSVGVKNDGTFGYFPTDYAEILPKEDKTSSLTGDNSESEEAGIIPGSVDHVKTFIYDPKYSEKDAVVKIESYWKCFKFRKQALKFLKKIRVRINLVKELVNSEQNYVEYLRCMKDIYITPLRDRIKNKKKILSEVEISQLFGNLEQLLDLAVQMLNELTRASKNSSIDLSQVFMRILPFLKLYVVYVQNYDKAVTLMTEKQKKDKEFALFLKTSRSNPRSKGLELRDLISKPFQRIFAYKNIFNRMIELTPRESTSYRKLETLDKQMEDLVQFINESKRQHENQQKLSQRMSHAWGADNRMQSLLLKRWRKYVREGRLRITYPIGSDKEDWVDCFMANDIFFFIKDNELRTMYIFLTEIVEKPTNDPLVVHLYSYPKETNSCKLRFSDELERREWVTDFIRCGEKEKTLGEERGIHGGANELLQKWITSLKIMEGRRMELEVIKEKLNSNGEQLKSEDSIIADIKKNIQQQLRKLGKHSANRKSILDQRADIMEDQKESVRRMEQTIDMGKETKDLFDVMFRNEVDAFPSVFGNTYTMFSDFLTYSRSMSLQEELIKEEKSETSLIVNQDLREELAKMNYDYTKGLGDLAAIIQESDYNEKIFTLSSQILELQHKLSSKESRIRVVEQENSWTNNKLEKLNHLIADLQKRHQSTINLKSNRNPGILFDEIQKDIPSLHKDTEYELLHEQIKSAELISELQDKKIQLEREISALDQSNKQYSDRIAELEHQLQAAKDISMSSSDDKQIREKLKPATPSRITKPPSESIRLEKLIQQKDKQNIKLQEEIKSLQEKIVTFKKEKDEEVRGLIRKMEILNKLNSFQHQSNSLHVEKLKAQNKELMNEVETYRSLLSENENRVAQLYQMIIDDSGVLRNQHSHHDELQIEFDSLRSKMLSLQYRQLKTDFIFVENEKLKKQLEEQKKLNESLTVSSKQLETRLSQAEEEIKRLTLQLNQNTERVSLKKHHSMSNIGQGTSTEIHSPDTTKSATASSTSPLTPPQRDSRPLPVPTRKISGGNKGTPPPPLVQSDPVSPVSPLLSSIITGARKVSHAVNKPATATANSEETKETNSSTVAEQATEDSSQGRAKRSATYFIPSTSHSRKSVPVKMEEEMERRPFDRRASHVVTGGAASGPVSFESILQEMRRKRNMNQ